MNKPWAFPSDRLFRKVDESYSFPSAFPGDVAALIAPLEQIERSTACTEQALGQALAMIHPLNIGMDQDQAASP